MAGASGKKILVVDDDKSLRQLYATQLKGEGFEVVEVGDGEEALAKVKSEKPDLVLMDVMMPKLDGVAVLRKLREDAEMKSLPVVMLTNFGQEELVKQAFSIGISDYLLKYKVTPAEMAGKVKGILGC